MTHLNLVSERIVKRLALLELLVLFGLLAVVGTMTYLAIREASSLLGLLSYPTLGLTILQTALVGFASASIVVLLAYCIAFFCHVYVPRSAAFIISTFMSVYIVSYYFVLLGWRTLWAENGLFWDLPALKLFAPAMGYGPVAIIAVMALRYLPVGVLLAYLKVSALPGRTIVAAHNLRVPAVAIHTKICLRWALPALGLVLLFTAIFASMDSLATSVAGGGSVQTVANLLDDWQRSHQFQGMAMWLGVSYVFLICLFLFLMVRAFRLPANYNMGRWMASEQHPQRGKEYWLLLSATLLVVLLEFSVVGAVVFSGIGGDKPGYIDLKGIMMSMFSDEELQNSALLGIQVSLCSSLIGTGFAAMSILARHIRKPGERFRDVILAPGEILILSPLIVPFLLAGVAASAFQGRVINYYGSTYSITVAHVIVFGPIAYFVIAAGLGQLSKNSYSVAKNLGVDLTTYVARIFLPACRFTIPVSLLLVFAFSFNESVLARYVGGSARSLGILIADKQVAALDTQHFAAMSFMFFLTLLASWMASIAVSLKRSRVKGA